MTITKLGHSCLIIKEGNLTILTDPGMYTLEAMPGILGLDVVLITDEHQDHFDIGAVQALLKNNPGAKIFTQRAVQKLLAEKGIPSDLLLDKQQTTIKDVTIEGCGEKHALLHSSIPQSDNTGYIIAGKFFYPGDALTVPGKPIEILALPVSGPWLKMSESIDYALEVHPKICFPVHDGRGAFTTLFEKILPKHSIEFVKPDKPMTF